MAADEEKQVQTRVDNIEQRVDSTAEADIPEKKAEELEALAFEYTPAEEARFLLKIDWIVLGYVSGAYLLAYMDRGNIGNANTAGMSADLGITDDQYQWLLTVLYMGYILFDWQTIFYKIFPARYYVPTVIIIWGIIAGLCGAAQNFAGMLVLRLLLGIFESSYATGLAYFFSFFYYRKEMGRRLGWYVSIAPVGASFAGVFAYFVTLYPHSIAGWRALFLVEGLPAIAVGLFGYWWLPSNALDCQFLNETEKKIAAARTVRQVGNSTRNHKVFFKEFLRSLFDLRNWLPTICYFCYAVSYSSLPIYIPAILQGMGFTALHAQGLSAPPYLFSALVVLGIGYLSDHFQMRGVFLIGCSCVGGIGFLILIFVNIVGVKYFAIFLITGGLYPCIGLVLSWVSNNNGSDSKRGAGFILMNFIGQCGPLLGTHLFPASDGPYYHKGFWISFGSCALSAFVAGLQILWLRHLNRQLDAKYGPAHQAMTTEEEIGQETDESEHFRYMY